MSEKRGEQFHEQLKGRKKNTKEDRAYPCLKMHLIQFLTQIAISKNVPKGHQSPVKINLDKKIISLVRQL